MVITVVVGGPVVIGGTWVVVGGCVVVGGAVVVVGGLVVVGGGCVVIGGAVVVEGGLVILGIKGSLHNVVLQQLTEQDTMEPPRTAFSKPHCWFWLQKSGGKHPTLKMGLFWAVSNAWSVRHVKLLSVSQIWTEAQFPVQSKHLRRAGPADKSGFGKKRYLSNKPYFRGCYRRKNPTRDVGRTREELVNHSPDGSWFFKKIQAWTGIEPMTSAIPVQRSSRLSYQANWELVNCEFFFRPYFLNCLSWVNYCDDHLFA